MINLAEILAALSTEQPFALATVVETKGHSPQKAGAKLVVGPQGLVAGTVGGGVLEATIIDACRGVLSSGAAQTITYQLTEHAEVNVDMVCGGTMTVFIERLCGLPGKT